jgi:nucleotide-binding universal stress UspA family protein
MTQQSAVVIGYDGSAFAKNALRKGLAVASALGAPVRIVRAWTMSNAPRPRSWAPGYVPPVDDYAEAIRELLAADVAAAAAQHPELEVSLEVPHGAAGRELVKASADAQLVVVGTRGLGGFSGLLLGSVSDEVVEHAHCDVLIVRTRPDGHPEPIAD